MSAPVPWPQSLWWFAEHGSWSESTESNTVSFEPEVGKEKKRRRAYLPGFRLQFSRIIYTAELETFLDFYHDDLASGTLNFTATDPRTERVTSYQFVDEPSWADAGPDLWRLRFSLRKDDGDPTAQHVLLIPFDGPNGATTTADFSPSNHPLDFEGDAALSTSAAIIGVSALALDGTADRVMLENHPDFQIEEDELFTIHAWIRLSSSPSAANQAVIGRWDSGTNNRSWQVVVVDATTTPTLRFIMSLDGTMADLTVNGGTIATDTPVHVAVTRDEEGVVRTFVDGVLAGSAVFPDGAFDAATIAAIGAPYAGQTSGNFTGAIDQLEFIKGTALWTESFTPPQ